MTADPSRSPNPCPPEITGTDGVVPASPSRSTLLPAGWIADSVLVCDYRGSLLPPAERARLEHRRTLGSAAARRLSLAIESITLTAPPSGDQHCPTDVGTVTVLALTRADQTYDLWWHTSGCQTMSNGTVTASEVATSTFGDFRDVFARETAAS